jgi:hypothetical protein
VARAPGALRVDSLHEVVRAVLDVALGGGGDQEASERLVRAGYPESSQRMIDR